VRVGPLAGYIEYPSHYENGLDSPVGLVFRAEPLDQALPRGQWFTVLPENMHEEQTTRQVPHSPARINIAQREQDTPLLGADQHLDRQTRDPTEDPVKLILGKRPAHRCTVTAAARAASIGLGRRESAKQFLLEHAPVSPGGR
jgi:hypothetical protein